MNAEGSEIVEEVMSAGKVIGAAEVVAKPGAGVVRRGRPPVVLGIGVAAGFTNFIPIIIVIQLISNRVGDFG